MALAAVNDHSGDVKRAALPGLNKVPTVAEEGRRALCYTTPTK